MSNDAAGRPDRENTGGRDELLKKIPLDSSPIIILHYSLYRDLFLECVITLLRTPYLNNREYVGREKTTARAIYNAFFASQGIDFKYAAVGVAPVFF